VEVLGWEPSTERIYVRQTGDDESLERNCVYFYDLRSVTPARPRIVQSSRYATDPAVWTADTVIAAQRRAEWRRFEKRLARLTPLRRSDEGLETIVRDAMVIDDQAVNGADGPVRRCVVDVSRALWPGSDSILVTTYMEPRVSVVRRYHVPGREAQLFVLAFLGDPYEGGYEVQGCVLIGWPGGGPQRLDCWYGALPCPSPQ